MERQHFFPNFHISSNINFVFIQCEQVSLIKHAHLYYTTSGVWAISRFDECLVYVLFL